MPGRLTSIERIALERARVALAIPASEQVLDFAVVKAGLCVLPDPFPFPIRGTIELVSSELALYVHASGVQARWTWPDLLQLEVQRTRRLWLLGRLTNGGKIQIRLGRKPRPALTAACAQHYAWSQSLSESEKSSNRAALASFDDQDSKKRARVQRIAGVQLKQPAAEGYVIVRRTGERIPYRKVSLMDDSMVFVNPGDPMHRSIVPFASLGQFELRSDGETAELRASCTGELIEVVVRPSNVKEWQDLLSIYIDKTVEETG